MINPEIGPNHITYTDQFGVVRPIEDFGKNLPHQPEPQETPKAPTTTEIDPHQSNHSSS